MRVLYMNLRVLIIEQSYLYYHTLFECKMQVHKISQKEPQLQLLLAAGAGSYTRVQSSALHWGTNWLQMRRISGSSAAEVRSAMPIT